MQNTWILFVEAGVALSLLLLIVWATWPRQKKRPPSSATPAAPAGQDKTDEPR